MISLGFDQSYTRIGVTVTQGTSSKNGKILTNASFSYRKKKTKTEKRLFVAKMTKHLIEKYKPDVIIVERIRTFSQGMISVPYIKTTGALIATIVDNAYPIEVYSADTRSWKARVCGKSKGMHKADKGVSVRFIRERFGLEMNDDAADSVCISLYGLDMKRLMKEKLLKKED